ncbi:MAG: ThuA domain-containing protein [Gemmataceae bacterium]|nr:ThuA domain-containing protein [Gemmataceae bacterium]
MTLILLALLADPAAAENPWLVFPGGDGPGKGRHVVLVAGDDEYRSEEAMPQLGRILSTRHGFKCTVLFPIDPKTGFVKPDHQGNIPGLEALKDADLAILFLRFRNLPDEQLKHLDAYVKAGKPVIGLRTSTHAFNIPKGKAFHRWSDGSGEKGWEGGFGRRVFGEKWISHHGGHGSQATRGILDKDAKDHPVLRGLKDGDIFGPSDVYGVRLPLPGDSKPLVLGEVVNGMKPGDPALKGKKNAPMMPIAWTKSYEVEEGKKGQAFCCTCCSSQDLESAGLRRLLVNASLHLLGLDEQIKPDLNVDLVGEYKPTPFKFGGYQKGKKPADFAK